MSSCTNMSKSPMEEPGAQEQEYVEIDPTGRYGRFDEILGKGAMKTVYKAIDEVLGLEVAWNQVRLVDFIHSPDDLKQLYCEVHLLSTLNHPSIIRFFTSWIDIENRTFNFITEMLTSGTLREYIAKYKRISMRAIKTWARQVLEGLVYLHGLDPPVMHRDLKCDNIFVNGHLGEVKIGDLGLAAILHRSRRAHSIIGTPEFMAPEVYEENYNELADIYSFGMCVLEMITFEYPYSECCSPAQIYKKVTSGKKPRAFYKVKDLEAQRFIGKCLETAQKRLSAKEMLLDPFLDVDRSNGHPTLDLETQKPFLNDRSELEKLYYQDAPRTNMTITGKLGADGICLQVQICDKKGEVSNIFFPFDIDNDTPLEVANEMVKELEISDWRPSEIANMIDGEISGLVPSWNPEYNHDHPSPFSAPYLKPQDRFIGELYEDTSSQSSSNSDKYSNWASFFADENDPVMMSQGPPPRTQQTPANAVAHHHAMRNKTTAETPKFVKNRSLVNIRSQLLHRSLVEELTRRREFKTVDTLETIGFQCPYKAEKSRNERHARKLHHGSRRI